MIFKYKGISIYYKDQGKGDTVLLLHGFLETSTMWETISNQLVKTNRVITIDLLGHGNTDCLGYIHTMEDMAEAVSAILLHLNISNFSAIGHSMGGYVALALVEKHPEWFTSLCLMNSTFEADTPERKAIRKRAIAMAKTNYQNLVRLSFSNLFAPESKIRFKDNYNNALAIALKTPVQGYIAAQEGMLLRPNRLTTFKNLEAKKAIIIGKKDSLIDGNRLKKLVENTDINVTEFSEGHMSHIENSVNLLTFITHFIEK